MNEFETDNFVHIINVVPTANVYSKAALPFATASLGDWTIHFMARDIRPDIILN